MFLGHFRNRNQIMFQEIKVHLMIIIKVCLDKLIKNQKVDQNHKNQDLHQNKVVKKA